MLGSRTPLYVFEAGTVNSQRYTDEIREAYVRFFWVQWTRTTFLWTIMRGHTEIVLLMNFIKEQIFAIWIDPRGLRIKILFNIFGMVYKKPFLRAAPLPESPGIKIPAFGKMGVSCHKFLLTPHKQYGTSLRGLYSSSQWSHSILNTLFPN
ncbi:hypothetical protein TNCV_346721 [Trichonephila clavipes]|nr:hypothetical protein TNCV_346721 [Trichonephila clavipes]